MSIEDGKNLDNLEQLGDDESSGLEFVNKWENEWKEFYQEPTQNKIIHFFHHFGLNFSLAEIQHYFDSMVFVDQAGFRKAIEDTGCETEMAAEDAARYWGMQCGGKVFVNPIKDNGERLKPGTRATVHEVLHSMSEFFDRGQNVTRQGLMIEPFNEKIMEAVIDELACMINGDETLFSDYHDLMNTLRRIAPFELWVRATFDNFELEKLKETILEKFGQDGFQVIKILSEHEKIFELSCFAGGAPLESLKLPKEIVAEISGENEQS